MLNQVNFFYDRNQTNVKTNARYAITSYLQNDDEIIIKVYDFETGTTAKGIYDSDGGCITGNELQLNDEIAANEIINQVFKRLENKELVTW